MAGINLTGGIVRAITRSAEMRATLTGARPDAGMSLVDKLNLLRLVSAQPANGLDELLEQIRDGKQASSDAIFDSIKALVEGRPPGDGGDPAASDGSY